MNTVQATTPGKKTTGFSGKKTAPAKTPPVKAAPAKTPPVKAAPAKAAPAKTVRTGDFKPDAKITVVAKENPRREGTHGHTVFEYYRKAGTVAKFLEMGGKVADIRWDVEHDHIKVK